MLSLLTLIIPVQDLIYSMHIRESCYQTRSTDIRAHKNRQWSTSQTVFASSINYDFLLRDSCCLCVAVVRRIKYVPLIMRSCILS